MMRILNRVAAGLVIAFAVVYGIGALWVQIRIARHSDPTSKVQVHVVLAIPQKNHRTEFIQGETEDQTCVHSVFPHRGWQPCWYLQRHTEKQISF